MTNLTPDQIKEALKWTEDFILSHIAEDEADEVKRAGEAIKVLRKAISLIGKVDVLEEALKDIVSYDAHSGTVGICPYGCDCPSIARKALGIEGKE